MTKRIIIGLVLFCSFSSGFAQPFLRKQGAATQLIVNGQPFLMLGGELGNSSASSLTDLAGIFPKLKAMNLNTALVPAYWELIEPQQGNFDFTLIDGAINLARQNHLKIVFLWFGSWKNSMSCYAPAWVKENSEKYPRAITQSGKTLEMLTAFDRNNLEADKHAFVQLMKHLAAVDGEEQTVIMIQVENEIGMLESARDYYPLANELYQSETPEPFINYLQKEYCCLRQPLKSQWISHGTKIRGSWTELFGKSIETEEIFMAWHYGLYVQEIARAGKDAYPLPMYLNAALNSRGRKPGEYPSAGPLMHLLDSWKAAAPDIDFLAPDIYDPVFTHWCDLYQESGNPLFIPEIRLEEANAAQAFYAFGANAVLGFSPFSIEDIPNPETGPLTQAYSVLQQLLPLLAEIQGKNKTVGVLLDSLHSERHVQQGDNLFTFKHSYTLPWEKRTVWPVTGAILIQLAENEYLVAGAGVVITFGHKDDGIIRGISSIDEVEFNNGEMKILRRLNGDQSHQGRHLHIPAGHWSIQHVKLYNYK